MDVGLPQAMTALAIVLVGGTLALLAHRRGERAIALATAVGAATMLPSPRDWPISAALVGTSLAALAIVRLAAPRLALRPIRIARVALLRAPDAIFDGAIMLTALALYLAVGRLLFDWIPVIQDSQDQLFHARVFLSGRVVASPPPVSADFFRADNMILLADRWYSQYPPGHSIVLALGTALGAPWLVNPALSAATLLVIRRVGRDAISERVGRVAALLTLASPLVIYMASEFMNHASALLAASLVSWGVVRAVRSGEARWGLLAGAAAGWMATIRTFTAIAIVTPLAAWLVLAALRAPRRWPALLAMMIAGAAIAALILPFNAATNGHPLRMGYAVCYPEFHMGFGVCPPVNDVFTPAVALAHSLSNLAAMNLFFLGGALPSLGIAALGALRARRHPAVGALALSFFTMVGGYFFICWQDLTFGPRYLYELVAATAILCAIGLPEIAAKLARPRARPGVVLLLVLLGVVPFTPAIGAYYAHAYSLRGGITAIAEREIEGRAIVFVDGNYHRAFHAVTPELEARILYVRDLGDRNCEAARAFSDRAPYRARGDRLARYPDVCSAPP